MVLNVKTIQRWAVVIGVLSAPFSSAADSDGESIEAIDGAGPIEEIIVVGRQRSAATDVVAERLDASVPVDMLDAESIGRAGDSDVAMALRRLPGLTLVDDKFVYVRGLGERYSSTQLNGAAVPSPDLTRNVLPLDMFPASIIDALAVHKGFSPDLPAAFGGGNVDIRTKGGPTDYDFSIGFGSGWNSDAGDGLSYSGGSDDRLGTDDGTRALPIEIAQAIDTYRGSFGAADILTVLNYDGGVHTIEEAFAVNRRLATTLNRDIDIRPKSLDPDMSGQVRGGYRWFLGDLWEASFLALGSYDNEWRNKERVLRRVTNPETDFAVTRRTIESVNLTASLGFGLDFTDDHSVKATGLFLRNSEDEAAIGTSCAQGQFNDCTSGTQGRIYDVRFEERELGIGQVSGSHTLGDSTLELLHDSLAWLGKLQGLQGSWYYSDSEATTDIPNEVRVTAVDTLDVNGLVSDTSIRSTGTAMDYRFSDLLDDVVSYGWDLTMPIYGDGWDLEIGGGYDYLRKARDYRQTSLGLGSNSAVFNTISSGSVSEVFSDANILDPDNGIEMLLGVGGFGLETYAAAQINESGYGKFDLLVNDTWRFAGGVRFETFTQVSVPIDPLVYGAPRIPLSAEEIAESVIQTDTYYPALALTYVKPGFWSDQFQLRLGWSETVGRPDLREVSQSTYIDPLTEARVRGNPMLRPSQLNNVDLRAEWFWDSGDNLTTSVFYKDIRDPIETVQGGATEDNVLFTFVNAQFAKVYGLEVEWLKGLNALEPYVGAWIGQFYVAGNLTLSDSQIDIRPGSAGVGNITSTSRRLSQHSQWVSNIQVGFDSNNGMHSASLVYNSFGERIFFAGINGQGDAFEQPFGSLDLVYSFFPTERLSVKLRARNLLDESVQIEQDGIVVIEQSMGATVQLDASWSL